MRKKLTSCLGLWLSMSILLSAMGCQSGPDDFVTIRPSSPAPEWYLEDWTFAYEGPGNGIMHFYIDDEDRHAFKISLDLDHPQRAWITKHPLEITLSRTNLKRLLPHIHPINERMIINKGLVTRWADGDDLLD